MSGQQLFDALRDVEIDLGPTFRWIDTIWRGRSEDGRAAALGCIHLPTGIAEGAVFSIHPGLIDGCLQLIGATTFDDANKKTTIPFAIESFHFARVSTAHPMWGYVEERDEQRWDIWLLDEWGQTLGEIRGVVPRVAAVNDIVPRAEPWRRWLYHLDWQDQPLQLPLGEAVLSDAEQWMIFADEGGVGEAIAARCRLYGGQPILVYPGAAYAGEPDPRADTTTVYIQPDSVEDFRQLFASYPAARHVIHLWSLDVPLGHEQIELEQATQKTCGTALHAVQSLMRLADPPHLWLITRSAQAVQAKDAVTGFAQSSLWGMGKIIGLENPALSCVCIDLDKESTLEIQSQHLWNEITTAVDPSLIAETQVALRNQERYVPRLIRYNSPVAEPIACHPDATYLVTGGLGALGLYIAQGLSARGAKHLMLMGRSTPNVDVQLQVDALAACGVDVTIAQADVADKEQVAQALAQVPSEYPLCGIVHTAGVLDDGILLHQEWSRFRKVMAPKILGAWNLHELTQEIPLDFFVLFSSTASLIGQHGQANYAAANAFMDALAAYRQAQGSPALSINWDAWREIGMAAEIVQREYASLQEAGRSAIPPEEGRQIFECLVAQGFREQVSAQIPAQIGVTPMAWSKYCATLPKPLSLLDLLNPAEEPSFRDKAQDQGEVRQQLDKAPAKARWSLLTTHVREQIVHTLKLRSDEQLTARQPLFDLGLDSLIALDLRDRLEASLGCSFPATLLFDYPTVETLSAYLAERVGLSASEPEGQENHLQTETDLQSESLEALADQQTDDDDAEDRLRALLDEKLADIEQELE